MIMKIALVGVETDPQELRSMNFEEMYQNIGRNTGNMLFTKAVNNQIDGEIITVRRPIDPDNINSNFDHVVIPAANWINNWSDLGAFAKSIEKLKIPLTVLGLGAQASLSEEIPEIKPGTRRLLEVLSDKSITISVRGEFTKSVLSCYGVKNVVVTGCPSIYYYIKNMTIQHRVCSNNVKRVVFGGSRSRVSNKIRTSYNIGDKKWLIYKSAYLMQSPIIYQSELPELNMLITKRKSTMLERVGNRVMLKRIREIYGANNY